MTLHGGTLPPGFTRFSTSGLPDTRRIPQWEEHNARSLVGLRAQVGGRAPLQASELNLTLPTLQLARVTGTPHRVQRHERDIADHPARGIIVYFAVRGRGYFSHRGGREIIDPGQGIMLDADQPFKRGFADGLVELALKVPREVIFLATGSPNLNRPQSFTFGGWQEPSGAAPALARTIDDALSGRPSSWEELETTILGLLGSLLEGPGAASGHVAAAHALISATFADPDLSAERIAAAIGVSGRQLSRVFAETGRSIPQTILETRLAEAQRLLADPTEGGATMEEVAARTGFASQAQFSRSYRERFGEPPLRHRRELTMGTIAS